MKIFRSIIILCLISCTFYLTGCSGILGYTIYETVEDIKDVEKGETIVVGRVVLDPPLALEEQFTRYGSGKDILIGFYEKKPPKGIVTFNFGERKKVFAAKLDKTFFIKSPSKTFYIVGATVQMKTEKLNLPSRFKVKIRPNDKAIYIGTLYYKRDEFNNITKVDFKDEYKSANRAFRKKFGRKYKLKKRLLTPVK